MIPIGDNNRRRTRPWVNYTIILLNVAVFLYMFSLNATPPATQREEARQAVQQTRTICYGYATYPTDADRFICKYAFQPKEFFDTLKGDSPVTGSDRIFAVLAIITSMFLHGGWLHIIGNMLFLWVFGDNIEDRLGHAAYLLFYLLAGIVAATVQGVIDPNTVIPVLGASGAVAGVLGAYLIWFPKATIRVVIPFFILIFIPLPIPAWIMIGAWFAQNLLAGYATIADAAAPDAGVAWFAHIGGFIFGMLIALLAGHRPRRPQPRIYS
ncbi:MAG: rhomboid family intramembrane serine protease [bacterium]